MNTNQIDDLKTAIAQLEGQLTYCDEQDAAADAQLGASFAVLAAGEAVPEWYTQRGQAVAQRRKAVKLGLQQAREELADAEKREALRIRQQRIGALRALVAEDDAIGEKVGGLFSELCVALREQAEKRSEVSRVARAMVGRDQALTPAGWVDLGLADMLRPEHLYRLASIQLHGELGWWPYESAPDQAGRPYSFSLAQANTVLMMNFDEVIEYRSGEFAEVPSASAPKPVSGARAISARGWATGG